MNTKELRNAVLSSQLLELAIERFTDVNALKVESTETECFLIGYLDAVKDIYKFINGDNNLIMEIYEKKQLTTK